MARGRQEWTQAKFERYIKEGRGQGSGEKYKPWITFTTANARIRLKRLYPQIEI
ncbi:hypothetical protein [uncultured Nostoc sp.]|uniref:hypothetical protein n=1 Tax=uncultured Nostoc sp. TaxID=340711 RepID=UPI0035CA1B50